jgi:N,N-dimethylformamidase beta subunit-like protein
MGYGRRGVRFLLAGSLVLVCLAASAAPGAHRLDPVQAENAQQGSPRWGARPAPADALQAYASQVSVQGGDRLDLHVSTTPAASYRVEIYRLGWYGGLGGRLMACLPTDCSSEQGQARSTPPPAADGYLDAAWPVTDSLRVPPQWLSGYYLATLRLESGPYAGQGGWVPFVVRAPATQQSAVLVVAAVNTWQAYNDWGGFSLYHDPSGGPCKGVCRRVSFDRPFDPKTQNLWDYELPLVHFLEENGVDVSYTTDVDVDRDPGELLRHRLVIVAGHDEYWTKAMRDGFDRARALGTNLAFMGANDGYWQMRYADDRRTIVEYRVAGLDPETDPALKTVRFRDLVPPRPECLLEGVEFTRDTSAEAMGGQHPFSVAPAALSDPWFAGTGFTAASTLPDLVGYEWDAGVPGCVSPAPTPLFHFDGPPATADAVRFTAPSGAIVFSAGSLSFAKGLDDFHPDRGGPTTGDPRLEAFMRNALADLVRPAAPLGVTVTAGARRVRIALRRAADPRIVDVRVFRAPAGNPLARGSRGMHFVCSTLGPACVDATAPRGRTVRYVIVLRDRWGSSKPYVTAPVSG